MEALNYRVAITMLPMPRRIISGVLTGALFLAAGCSMLTLGALAEVNGTVTSAATGAPIAGALVTVSQLQSYQESTDASGRYSLTADESGRTRIEVEANGYLPFTQTVTVRIGRPNVINVRLTPLP